jgi:hypothetical protein
MNTPPDPDETFRNSTSSGFVADGHERAVDGVSQTFLPEIRMAVEAKYASELAQARPLRRLWIRLRINREIKRRVKEEIENKAPPDAMYGVS